MASLVHALYLMLTQATHGDLIRQIEYLKVENEILRNRLHAFCPARNILFAFAICFHVAALVAVRLIKMGEQPETI